MSDHTPPFDPFLRLTHLYSAGAAHRSSPLFLRPERVVEIVDGTVYVEGNGSYTVREKAEEIRDLVIRKLAENREAATLGKT